MPRLLEPLRRKLAALGASNKPPSARAQFWRSLPLKSTATFFAAVFCLFASFAFIFNSPQSSSQSGASVALNVLVGGGTAAVFAFFGTRQMYKTLIVLAVLEFLILPNLLSHFAPSRPSSAPIAGPAVLHHQYVVNAWGAAISIIAGYLLILYFAATEGRRYLQVHSEMKLAADIHRALVPEISRRIGKFELYGASVPSGMVGGDVLDVIEHGDKWFSYVADVSGHGVPAGVLMAMVKAAARTRLSNQWRTTEFLQDLNGVIQPLLQPGTFVTFAYLCTDGDEKLEFSLAGHLPILHFHPPSAAAEEHSTSNLPLGIFPEQGFESSSLAIAPGDLLVILTDGLPETFDAQQRELGMEEMKKIVGAVCAQPLKNIFEHARSTAQHFGIQADDQTMLLIRRLAD
jgi:hypothetical protein